MTPEVEPVEGIVALMEVAVRVIRPLDVAPQVSFPAIEPLVPLQSESLGYSEAGIECRCERGMESPLG
jgi:hypothetical protein